MNWPRYSKKAPCNSDKVDYMELSCKDLNCPHFSAEPVGLLSTYTSIQIFGNKFKEKTLLPEECYIVYKVIYFQTLPYEQDRMYANSLSVHFRGGEHSRHPKINTLGWADHCGQPAQRGPYQEPSSAELIIGV